MDSGWLEIEPVEMEVNWGAEALFIPEAMEPHVEHVDVPVNCRFSNPLSYRTLCKKCVPEVALIQNRLPVACANANPEV